MRKSGRHGSAKLTRPLKKAQREKTRLIFEDEASFRRDSTLHRTWSRVGCQPVVPVTGQRKSVKVFGCVDIYSAEFFYTMDEVFNTATYLSFLASMAEEMFQSNRRVHYIQDNASYHKSAEVWDWFKENRKWIEVYNLPPYSPEFNAAEPLWKHTRKEGTHNKCFESKEEVEETLHDVFGAIQKKPDNIRGYLIPFQ